MPLHSMFKKPVVIILVLLCIGFIWAYSNGISGRTLLSSTPGCTCHSSQPSTDVNVEIVGTNTMQPGAMATFKVKISGGPLKAAGVNIAADAGTLQPYDNSLKILNNELTHNGSPKNPVNNMVVFDFQFTAPQTEGTVTLAATGNSVNLNGSNSGDAWNHAPNFTINVTSSTGIDKHLVQGPVNFRLKQNFPNPFNPSTTIPFYLPQADFIKLSLFDNGGRLISILKEGFIPAGQHVFNFNASASNLPSGTYFYTLQTSQGRQTRKMLLLK